MPTDVIMPQMGESIVEGTITKWLKKVGDTVLKDEPLFEISTDKVDAEIPSPAAGVLAEIRFAEGTTVAIHTVVAVLGENGSAAALKKPQEKSASRPAGKSPAGPGQPAPPSGKSASSEPARRPLAPSGTEVVMPQMGESIFEGTIVKWLKQIGDPVEKDEPLFEISTDKVDAEIPSPVAGVLADIRAQQGQTVGINAVVAVIGSSTVAAVPDRGTPEDRQPLEPGRAPADLPRPQPGAEHTAPPDPGRRLRSSPLVRRIAREHRVDLARVPGTGSGGRISKTDILSYLGDGGDRDRETPGTSALEAKIAPPPSKALTSEVVPLTKMRSIIAQRMVESKRISPHVHSVYKADMTRIVRLREREKAGFEARHQVKLTYMPFIAVAAIEALRRFPIVNASLIDNAIQYHANIHLGIAVALEWGLIVPTVHEAEKLSFAGLAKAMNDLAGRARVKKLLPAEVGGSTFTLTNPGIFGDEFGMPIINQPESAILAIGAMKKEPVVLTDAEGNDTIAIRSTEYFCLGFDHRLIDGADAGRFMSEFKRVLETWDQPVG